MIKVLLISDDFRAIKNVEDGLSSKVAKSRFALKIAHRMSDGLKCLNENEMDIVLLDLILPDAKGGLVALDLLRYDKPYIPKIILVDGGDEKLGERALSEGAREFIEKSTCTPELLCRSIEYSIAIERSRSTVDELNKALHRSDKRLRELVENDPYAVVVVDENYRILMANGASGILFAQSPEDLIGEELTFGILVGKSREIEVFRTKDEKFTAQVHAVRTEWESKEAYLVSMRDVSRQKVEQEHSQRSKKLEKTLAVISNKFVGVGNLDEAIKSSLGALCRLSASDMSYLYLRGGISDIMLKAHSWREQGGYVSFDDRLPQKLDTSRFRWLMDKLGRGEVVHVSSVENLPVMASPEKEAFEERDVRSFMMLPIINEKRLVGMIGFDNVLAGDEWSKRDMSLLRISSEIIGSNALENMRADERTQESLGKFRKALDGMMRAMVIALEMRDPYTAGHQRRVAELAKAIAIEMEMSQSMIDGVHVAGVIHDIGKMYVPPEILSKPGRLDQIEFDLVKVHPKAGYEIAKSVEFPWNVEDMMLQHHERLDGSGYPCGLSGSDILPESRILSVADVVETMTSNRPYRNALGVDKAIDEIKEQKGVLYDTDVVEACISLFKEKGFTFGYNLGSSGNLREV